ncbi:putative methyltransferase-domain-containing protein [Blastocladiella britannica]|nr:putative methyltransferase-domain-containing protein [Blastocladiella britannica]
MANVSGLSSMGERHRVFAIGGQGRDAPPRLALKVGETSLASADLGGTSWGAGVVLAWMFAQGLIQNLPANPRILELGAGTGLGGLAAAAMDPTALVTLTDYHEGVLATLRENLAANKLEGTIAALDWSWFRDATTIPTSLVPPATRWDLIMAADVVYDMSTPDHLDAVLARLDGDAVLMVLPMRPRYAAELNWFEKRVAGHRAWETVVLTYRGAFYKVYSTQGLLVPTWGR